MIPPLGATADSSKAFLLSKQVNPQKIRAFSSFSVSALGLGTYLGAHDDKTDAMYAEAIESGISRGINFIDAAINYRCQRSERIIGSTFKKLIESKKVKRSEVVIATKGGFIPFDGAPPVHLENYIRQTWIDTGLIKADDIVSNCHCLHPSYLQHQLTASLKNLGLDTIDVYYLHNPETQLPVVGEKVFYERMREAFAFLETQVEKGKIQVYGVATWNAFRDSSEGSVSLSKLLEIARTVGGEKHHFRAVQLPYNFAMLEAIGKPTQSLQGKQYPILSVAHHYNMAVMISAPLLQGQLINLSPSMAKQIPGSGTTAQKCLQFVSSTPGVVSALAGMKSVTHVEENAQILKLNDWSEKDLQSTCDVLVKKH